MHLRDLAQNYESKSDEELLQLDRESECLTFEAKTVLRSELARRGITVGGAWPALSPNQLISSAIRREPRPSNLQGIRAFTEEVLRLYNHQLWLFLKLVFPAAVIGYIAIMVGRSEAQEFARHIPRGSPTAGHEFDLLGVATSNLAGYFISWSCTCFSFAATCWATAQIAVGNVPSASDSFAAARGRTASLLRLSSLLFVLLLSGVAVALLASVTVLWGLSHYSSYRSSLLGQVVMFTCLSLPLLALSRFGLAVPAVILDNCGVSKSIFLSDELTEGKWVLLAALLVKSLVGGYVAAMSPFWLASWIARSVDLPYWFHSCLTAASVAGVTLVEPIMFLGFSLLYLETSPSRIHLAETPACEHV